MINTNKTSVAEVRKLLLAFLMKPRQPAMDFTEEYEEWFIDEIWSKMTGGVGFVKYQLNDSTKYTFGYRHAFFVDSSSKHYAQRIVRVKYKPEYIETIDIDKAHENKDYSPIIQTVIGLMEEYARYRIPHLGKVFNNIFTSGVANDFQRLQRRPISH